MSRKSLSVLATCAVCLALMGASRGAITKLTVNPDAPVVDLFDGKEQGQFDVRLVAMNANEGRIFITNKTDKPLSVSVPKGLAGVQILAQPGFVGGNLFGQNGGLLGQNGQAGLGQGQGQTGAAQTVGGNAGQMNGNGNGNGFPNGQNQGNFQGGPAQNMFFSIPPEKTVQIALNSVCLNYGRRDPHAGMKYELVKAETVTTDPVLQQLLEDYSPGTNQAAQQAAAWHLANGLSWEQIAQLKHQQLAGDPIPMFSAEQIRAGRGLSEQAQKKAADRPKKSHKVESARTVVAK